MSKIIGIDLGTTNSVVAVYEGDSARLIAGTNNENRVPSIVAFDDAGSWCVGEAARNQQVLSPAGTVYSVKRFMGRRQEEVESEKKLVPYTLTGKPDEFVRVRVGKHSFTPQEISGMILGSLKAIAEQALGEPVERAVITVPAYFNDAQRQATKDAGEIAGLTVERIINEPTAAALAYGVERRGSRCIVVFDLGGGTFDLSALRIGGGEFQVLAVQGNTHLGGDDFDQRIIDVVADDFVRRERIDVRQDAMALQRLKQASQAAKVELSGRLETRVMLPFIAMDSQGPKHLDYELSRERFEAVCHDLFEELGACCKRLLRDAGLDPSDVDDVVMVGGATRIPRAQEIAREVFKTDELDKSINPDEVVALGAAILGGVMQGDVRNVALMDVTSHSFGVETANGGTMVLVPKDTPIPATVKQIFSTPRDNQTSVPIKVLEGESDVAAQNRTLGVFRLAGLRRAPRGVPQIEVAFEIDANGILQVGATDMATGHGQKIVVTGSAGLEETEIRRMKAHTEQHTAKTAVRDEKAAIRHRAESMLFDTRKWLEIHAEMLAPRAIEQIESTLTSLQKRLQKDDVKGMALALRRLNEVMQPFRKAG